MSTETIIAVAYAAVFLLVCFKHPKVALMLTFASAPFQNDLSGDLPVRFSMAEVNLVLSALVYVRVLVNRGQFARLGPLAVPLVLYFAISLLSSLRDWRDTTTISLVQTATYLIVAVTVFAGLAETVADYRWSFYGLVAVGVFIAAVSLVGESTTVLNLNKNGAGGSLSCGLLVALELWLNTSERRQKWLLLGAMAVIAIGLIYTLSRGAWLGTITGLIVLFAVKGEFKSLVKTLAVLTPLVAIAWINLPPESQDFATGFDTQRVNIAARLVSIETAQSYFLTEPVLGVGVGLRKEFDATNVVMTMLAETGVLGLGAFVLIHIVLYRMIWTSYASVPRESLASSVLAIAGALVASKLGHGLVDHYWSRGSLMLAWAGVGMAILVHYRVCDSITVSSIPSLRKAGQRRGELIRALRPYPVEVEFPHTPLPRRGPIRGPIVGGRLRGLDSEDR